MADIANKYAENASGKFYCDDQCLDCDLCRETAPANFTRSDDGGYSYVFNLSNRPPRRRRRFARKPWKDVRLKPSATMAKTECDRTMTMNCLAKPTQRTGKPEAPARASVPERLRRLKWNEAVWSGDFVADERLGLQLWEGPGVFRPGSFARPIYRKEETKVFDRPQPENQNHE